jgi:hypothetical protein
VAHPKKQAKSEGGKRRGSGRGSQTSPFTR